MICCENVVRIAHLKKKNKKEKKIAIHKKFHNIFHNSWVDKLLLVLI